MIIDCILDRKYDDELMEQGYDSVRYPNGEVRSLKYDAHKFYYDVFRYGEIGHEITRAMDGGTEQDVRRALCDYIVANGYNNEICEYVNSRNWLTA